MPLWRRSVERIAHALSAEEVAQMRAALTSSPLLSRSPLAGTFRDSRGFGATFTLAGRAELEQRLPAAGRFLELALQPSRVGGPAAPNAFFLNVLVLDGEHGVGRHLDGTLRRPAGDERALPVRVSVLYLTGGRSLGALRLWRGPWRVATIAPVEGLLVHFRGDLDHEVLPGTAGALRLSLVCEQYALAEEALANLPTLQVQSKAGFAAHLDDHRSAAKPRTFELD